MKCRQCKLVEMMVKNINTNTVEYICKKCGKIVKETIKDENSNIGE